MRADSATDPLLQQIGQSLQSLVPGYRNRHFLLAYSGGVDSHVLLHACKQLGLHVRALYVDHQLQHESGAWGRHCAAVCAGLGIDYRAIRVEAGAAGGQSPEAVAREARYRALAGALEQDEILLLAQHRDDQAETVLLQLLRGAGPAGLSAMPAMSTAGAEGAPVTMARPMLELGRDEILAYARAQALQWVDDPSNSDTAIRRNAIRHDVMPAIASHWPGATRQLASAARQQQEAAGLLDELARLDLAQCASDDPRRIDVEYLFTLTPARQFNLLRFWLAGQGARPNRKCICQVIRDVPGAQADAAPVVGWSGFEVRRFERSLYLLTRTETAQPANDSGYRWSPAEALNIASTGQIVTANRGIAAGLQPAFLESELTVRFRRGGERIAPHGQPMHHSLKKLFHEARVPPWERARVPLIFCGEKLLAVGEYWLANEHCVGKDEPGWRPVITRRR